MLPGPNPVSVACVQHEHNNPPLKFARLYEDAAAAGMHLTAHCDIDRRDSIDHIRQALEIMGAERIDRGTNIVEDPDLVDFVVNHQIGLTSCPSSNSFVRPQMKGDGIPQLLSEDAKICINSDDSACFGGYVNDNYYALADQFNLTQQQVVQLIRNSFEASWISHEKVLYLAEINDMFANAD